MNSPRHGVVLEWPVPRRERRAQEAERRREEKKRRKQELKRSSVVSRSTLLVSPDRISTVLALLDGRHVEHA